MINQVPRGQRHGPTQVHGRQSRGWTEFVSDGNFEDRGNESGTAQLDSNKGPSVYLSVEVFTIQSRRELELENFIFQGL